MDAKRLLDQVIRAGRDLVDQGRGYAEQTLDLPETGPERDQMLANAGKGAAAASALLLLLGTRSGRRLAGSALKLGSLAALGGLAYKTYRDWQAGNDLNDAEPAGMPIGELTGDAETQRSRLLLRAMIAAANSDGHVSAEERNRLSVELARVSGVPGADSAAVEELIDRELREPASIAEIAKETGSRTAASEVYLISAAMLDREVPAARDYLQRLALALALDSDLVSRLESAIVAEAEPA